MKFLRIFLYILAAILFLAALVMLFEVLTARRAVEAVLYPYLFLLGGSGPIVENLIRAAVAGVQSLFLVLFFLCLLGSGLMFGLARLMGRVERQSRRIQELEAELAQSRWVPAEVKSSAEIPAGQAPLEGAPAAEGQAWLETNLAQGKDTPGEGNFRPAAERQAGAEAESAGPPADEPLPAGPPVDEPPPGPENSAESR